MLQRVLAALLCEPADMDGVQVPLATSCVAPEPV
jgi:hypothetical protein